MKTILATHNKVILVDDSDFDLVSKFKWSGRGRYPVARIEGKTIELHRILIKPPFGFEVDHKNRNTFDNRRDNLRIATHKQNLSNRSKSKEKTSNFKGVSWHTSHNKWRSTITTGNPSKQKFLGHFHSPYLAAKAYDAAARKLFGEFACVNFE